MSTDANPEVFKVEDDHAIAPPKPMPFCSRFWSVEAMYFFLGVANAIAEPFATMIFIGHGGPSSVQAMYMTIYLPWVFKPVFAEFITRSRFGVIEFIHFFLAASALLWGLCLFIPDYSFYVAALFFESMFIAIADVALDGVMIARAKKRFFQERGNNYMRSSLQLQAATQLWRAVGSMVGAWVGGFVFKEYHTSGVFIACGGSTVLFLACSYMLLPRAHHPHEPYQDATASGTDGFNRMETASAVLRKRRTVLALAFTFAIHAVPELYGLLDTFMVTDLGFDSFMIGTLDMIGNLGWLVGAAIYTKMTPGENEEPTTTPTTAAVSRFSLSPRNVLRAMIVIIAIEAAVVPPSLILGWYKTFGVDPKAWAAIGGFLRAASDKMLLAPILGSVMHFCNDLNGTTVYAVFTAAGNIGSVVALSLGSMMSEIAGLQKGHMTDLWKLYVAKGVVFLVMLFFTGTIPDPDSADLSVKEEDDNEYHTDVERSRNPETPIRLGDGSTPSAMKNFLNLTRYIGYKGLQQIKGMNAITHLKPMIEDSDYDDDDDDEIARNNRMIMTAEREMFDDFSVGHLSSAAAAANKTCTETQHTSQSNM